MSTECYTDHRKERISDDSKKTGELTEQKDKRNEGINYTSRFSSKTNKKQSREKSLPYSGMYIIKRFNNNEDGVVFKNIIERKASTSILKNKRSFCIQWKL